MTKKIAMSRQQLSASKRDNAGLTQVKVYLDQATLQLLELLQQNVLGREVKRDERNMSRSMVMIAGIHALVCERLDESVVTSIIEKYVSGDYPRKEPYNDPADFMLNSMINQLYSSCKSMSDKNRLKHVAGVMNSTSFRNPSARSKGHWKESDIEWYLPSLDSESKT